MSGDVAFVFPDTHGQACKIRRSKGGCLRDGGADDTGAEQVALQLHQEIIFTGAAVHPQLPERQRGVSCHCAYHIVHLKRDALQSRPGDVSVAGATAESADGGPGVGVPVWCAQAGERRHKVHSAVVGHALGQALDLRSRFNQAKLITKPLYHCSGREHASLEGVFHFAADLPGDSREQPIFGWHRLVAGMHQQKTPGSVSALGHATAMTALAKQGRLLISGHTCHGDGAAKG